MAVAARAQFTVTLVGEDAAGNRLELNTNLGALAGTDTVAELVTLVTELVAAYGPGISGDIDRAYVGVIVEDDGGSKLANGSGTGANRAHQKGKLRLVTETAESFLSIPTIGDNMLSDDSFGVASIIDVVNNTDAAAMVTALGALTKYNLSLPADPTGTVTIENGKYLSRQSYKRSRRAG